MGVVLDETAIGIVSDKYFLFNFMMDRVDRSLKNQRFNKIFINKLRNY